MTLNDRLSDQALNKKLDYVTRPYAKYLGREDLEQCKQIGIWKAYEHWKPDGGKKFENFAAKKVYWECVNLIKKHFRYKSKNRQFVYDNRIVNNGPQEEFFILMESLRPLDKKIIHKKFVEKKTLYEIGKDFNKSYEWARTTINGILEDIRNEE